MHHIFWCIDYEATNKKNYDEKDRKSDFEKKDFLNKKSVDAWRNGDSYLC